MDFIQNELKEIKELLGLSTSRLYKMTSNKEIPYYKPGGKKIYLNRQELEQWILNSRVASTNDLDDELDSYISRTNKNLGS